jgi:pimeloyl-ACP methyl ester carboxylesterase
MALQSQLFRGDGKLEAAAVSDPAHIVQGARGPHVAKIQQALIQLDGAAISQDSIYGPGTAAAVAAFKQKRNILNFQGKIDNIVGKKTMAALDSEMFAKEQGGGGGGDGSRRGIVAPLGSRTHTLIYFSGNVDGAGQGGVLLNTTPPNLTPNHGQVVLTDMERFPDDSRNKHIVIGFGGSIINQFGGAAQARFLIEQLHDRRGKLILYGFSAGGANALQLCRDLNDLNPNLKVDLLVTVDVALGATPIGRIPRVPVPVNRRVPTNVLLNRNYFQTSPSLNGSRGDRATGGVVIQNENRDFKFTSVFKSNNHGGMQDMTRDEARTDMLTALKIPRPNES